MKLLYLLLLYLCAAPLHAQTTCNGPTAFQILHYTETAGFDHRTRDESATMFEEIGAGENFTVVNSEDRSSFDDLAMLMTYEVIVFANTSGNIPFSDAQRDNLENYIESGGAVLGIHAATDMYRNGSFPFYTNLIGGSRRNNPAHTSNNYNGTMDLVGAHPSTDGLPDPWEKPEEYYYWPDTGLVTGITEVLRVRATGAESYDTPRPISWYQEFDSGARSFYTALGHARGNYTEENNDFRRHIRGALCWAVEAEAANLPVQLQDAFLTDRPGGGHRIHWRTDGPDRAARVELHGGDRQTNARLLATAAPGQSSAQVGHLDHSPRPGYGSFYYRLRFFDADGTPSWSPWLTAAISSGPGLRFATMAGGPSSTSPRRWLASRSGSPMG